MFVIGLLGFALVGWALGIAFAIATLVGSAEEPLGGDPLAYVLLGVAAVVWLFATRLLGLLVRGIRAAGNQPGPERRRKD